MHLKIISSTDQAHTGSIGKAIDDAWSVVALTDDIHPEIEARKVLALCVLQEAQHRKGNHASLVSQSIVSFRERRARNVIISRKKKQVFAKHGISTVEIY
jgi:hypothetical protein